METVALVRWGQVPAEVGDWDFPSVGFGEGRFYLSPRLSPVTRHPGPGPQKGGTVDGGPDRCGRRVGPVDPGTPVVSSCLRVPLLRWDRFE